MRFESKTKRNFWISIAIATIPDIAIAIILAVAFDGGFIGFLAVYFGLQILYFAIWTKNSIFNWAYFQLIGRKQVSKHLLDFLLENKFPDPGDRQESAEGYFYNIANNEELPIKIRFLATHEIAALNAYGAIGEAQLLLRIALSYEDAIEQYKRSLAGTHS